MGEELKPDGFWKCLGNCESQVNNYARYPRLKTAVGDATVLADVLRERFQARPLLDSQATRHAIIDALNEYRQLSPEVGFACFVNRRDAQILKTAIESS